MTVFVSFSFDERTKEIASWVRSSLGLNQIVTYVAGRASPRSPPEEIRDRIRNSEAFLAIIAREPSDWVQNEIGIAYDAYDRKSRIYGLLERGMEVGGILRGISTFHEFTLEDLASFKSGLTDIAGQILARRKEVATLSLTGFTQLAGMADSATVAVLTSTDDWVSRQTVEISIRFELPYTTGGDVVGRIYFPPDFYPQSWESDGDSAVKCSFDEVTVIKTFKAGRDDPFAPDWWGVEFVVPLLSVRTRLPDGWIRFRVEDVVVPKIAGMYFLIVTGYHRMGELSQPMDQFAMPTVLVRGEVETGTIVGRLMDSETSNPLRVPGSARALGIAVDPYAGESTGRPVMGKAFFTSTSKGVFSMEGLAPGIYDVFAEGQGYEESLIDRNVRVEPGKITELTAALRRPK